MIFDKIDNISDYFEELPLLKKVEEFVADSNHKKLSDGTYEIDGKRVFAMIQSYRTKQQTQEMMFEAHKKYIDLQYIVNGIEKIRWAKLDKVDLVEERYSAGGDIAFYEGDAMYRLIIKNERNRPFANAAGLFCISLFICQSLD